MTSRRILSLSIYLIVFMCLPVLAQKAGIDPALLKKANAGDAKAQLAVGEAYASGISVPQDYTKAASWLQKAADQGSAQAQFHMGTLCETGNGVPQDYTRAASWYQQAAQHGFAAAELQLGLFYDRGNGVPRITLRPQDGIAKPHCKRSRKPNTTSAPSTNAASASHRTTLRRPISTAAPPSRETPPPSSTSPCSTTMAPASRRTTPRPRRGTPRPPSREFPAPSSISAQCMPMARESASNLPESYFWLELAAKTWNGSRQQDAVNARDLVAQHLSPTDLAAAQDRAAKWLTAHQK